jgi:dTDP-4-dehydrorhamnose reductase
MPLFQGWIQALEKKEVIHPFSDKVMAPIPLLFTVTVLYRIAQARLPGIVQVSGEKDVTYSQVAYYIAQRMGADFGLVQSISSKEANPGSETDPLHTTLDTTRLRTKFGIEPPGVWSTIDTMLGL